MATTHSTATRNALCSAVNTAVNSGTTNPNGQLILMTSGDVEVATLNLSDPAFLSPASGSMSLDTVTGDSDATGGVVAQFKIVDRDGTEVYRGTVTVTSGGGDLEMASLTVTAGSVVNCSSLTYTASA